MNGILDLIVFEINFRFGKKRGAGPFFLVEIKEVVMERVVLIGIFN
jgi:hypothetical protein